MFDAVKTKNECVAWIRQFFEENGKDCNAVIGISGGKDSSVVAALCCEALGKDRVIGVLMPCGRQADIDMAQLLVKHLGIKSYTVNIEAGVEGLKSAIDCELSRQTVINLPPRIRMATLYAVSQSNNGRVANTCNLSEDWVGYSTRYGDSVGDFSPCSNLTVAEVKEIGRVLGLPKVLVDKAPSDGLTGLTDEDNLGFTYAMLDKYIRTGEIDDPEKKAIIDRKHRTNLFKLQLMPAFNPGLKVFGPKSSASSSLGASVLAGDSKLYDLALIVGRFQPLHLGHEDMISTAISLCRETAVFIGSSQESGTEKNPFSFEQRKQMLENIYGNKISIYPLPDIGVGDCNAWGEYVKEKVMENCGRMPQLLVSGTEDRRKNWFDPKDSKSMAELYIPKTIEISASEIRRMISEGSTEWEKFVNPANLPLYKELFSI